MGSLPTIVRAFKAVTTRRINRQRHNSAGQVWQRSYWESVIRSERALLAIRQYIVSNPVRWKLDRYHPCPAGRDPQAAELWRLLREG